MEQGSCRSTCFTAFCNVLVLESNSCTFQGTCFELFFWEMSSIESVMFLSKTGVNAVEWMPPCCCLSWMPASSGVRTCGSPAYGYHCFKWIDPQSFSASLPHQPMHFVKPPRPTQTVIIIGTTSNHEQIHKIHSGPFSTIPITLPT